MSATDELEKVAFPFWNEEGAILTDGRELPYGCTRVVPLSTAIAIVERLNENARIAISKGEELIGILHSEKKELEQSNDDLKTENLALRLQKLQLEESGAEPTLIRQRDACKEKMLEACKERNEAQQQVATLTAENERLTEKLVDLAFALAAHETAEDRKRILESEDVRLIMDLRLR